MVNDLIIENKIITEYGNTRPVSQSDEIKHNNSKRISIAKFNTFSKRILQDSEV